jgi:hypothetical protein
MAATVTPIRPGVVPVERGVVQYAAPLTLPPPPRPCPVCGVVIAAQGGQVVLRWLRRLDSWRVLLGSGGVDGRVARISAAVESRRFALRLLPARAVRRLPGEGGRVMTASRGPRIGRKARERERQAEKARQRLANFTPEQKERHLQRRREWRRASLTPQSVSSI